LAVYFVHPRHSGACHRHCHSDRDQLVSTAIPLVASQLAATYPTWRARNRTGKGTPITNDVVVLDIYRNIATVRVISPDFVDYLHLAKLDGQ
jgi:hypothetical protein